MNNLELYHHSVSLDVTKPLYRQLARISGGGPVNMAQWLLSQGLDPRQTWIQTPAWGQEIVASFVRDNGSDEYPLDVRLKSCMDVSRRNLMRTRCYRGMRHKIKKRLRGQRTRTNNRVNRVLKGFQKKKS